MGASGGGEALGLTNPVSQLNAGIEFLGEVEDGMLVLILCMYYVQLRRKQKK